MIVALEPVVVAPWTSGPAVDRHDAIWSAWLHGSVAAIHNYGRLVLMVPVAALTWDVPGPGKPGRGTADGTLTSWVNSNTLPVGISNVAAIAIGGVSVVLLDVGPPIISAPLFNPVHNNGTFSVSLATQIGRVYGLEYKNSLTEAHWTGLPLVAGNGHVQTFSDQNAGRGPRFYRVRQW